MQMAVIDHRLCDLAGEPGADGVHGDRLRPRDLAHRVDIMDAAVDDRRGRAHERLMHAPERARRLLVQVHAHDERLAKGAADLDEARPRRMDAQDIADEQNLVRRSRGRDDPFGGFERVGERLLAEQSVLGRERLERHRRVVLGIGANGDASGLSDRSASVRPS